MKRKAIWIAGVAVAGALMLIVSCGTSDQARTDAPALSGRGRCGKHDEGGCRKAEKQMGCKDDCDKEMCKGKSKTTAADAPEGAPKDRALCANCGEIKDSGDCCKLEGRQLCGKCGKFKGSAGCCKEAVPRLLPPRR